jgi:hypothetical protein
LFRNRGARPAPGRTQCVRVLAKDQHRAAADCGFD